MKLFIYILGILILIVSMIIIYYKFLRKPHIIKIAPNQLANATILNEGDSIFSPNTDTTWSSSIYSQNKKYFTAISKHFVWGIYDSSGNSIQNLAGSTDNVKYNSGALCVYAGNKMVSKTNTNIQGKALLLMNNNGILQLLDSSGTEQWNTNLKLIPIQN